MTAPADSAGNGRYALTYRTYNQAVDGVLKKLRWAHVRERFPPETLQGHERELQTLWEAFEQQFRKKTDEIFKRQEKRFRLREKVHRVDVQQQQQQIVMSDGHKLPPPPELPPHRIVQKLAIVTKRQQKEHLREENLFAEGRLSNLLSELTPLRAQIVSLKQRLAQPPAAAAPPPQPPVSSPHPHPSVFPQPASVPTAFAPRALSPARGAMAPGAVSTLSPRHRPADGVPGLSVLSSNSH